MSTRKNRKSLYVERVLGNKLDTNSNRVFVTIFASITSVLAFTLVLGVIFNPAISIPPLAFGFAVLSMGIAIMSKIVAKVYRSIAKQKYQNNAFTKEGYLKFDENSCLKDRQFMYSCETRTTDFENQETTRSISETAISDSDDSSDNIFNLY